MNESFKIVDKQGLDRILMRIAHEILEKNKGSEKLCIVGIRTRGYALAERVNACIKQIEGKEVPFGVLDITLYRDDLTTIDT